MELRIAELARSDMLVIWHYIAWDNEQAANQVTEYLQLTFIRLLEFPLLGRDRSELLSGLRSFATGSYVIFSQIGEDILEIARIRHGATDLDNLFTDE